MSRGFTPILSAMLAGKPFFAPNPMDAQRELQRTSDNFGGQPTNLIPGDPGMRDQAPRRTSDNFGGQPTNLISGQPGARGPSLGNLLADALRRRRPYGSMLGPGPGAVGPRY